jgi:hypothetical protein
MLVPAHALVSPSSRQSPLSGKRARELTLGASPSGTGNSSRSAPLRPSVMSRAPVGETGRIACEDTHGCVTRTAQGGLGPFRAQTNPGSCVKHGTVQSIVGDKDRARQLTDDFRAKAASLRAESCRCRTRCAPALSDTAHGSHGFCCDVPYQRFLTQRERFLSAEHPSCLTEFLFAELPSKSFMAVKILYGSRNMEG